MVTGGRWRFAIGKREAERNSWRESKARAIEDMDGLVDRVGDADDATETCGAEVAPLHMPPYIQPLHGSLHSSLGYHLVTRRPEQGGRDMAWATGVLSGTRKRL